MSGATQAWLTEEQMEELRPPCESSKDERPAEWIIRADCPACGLVEHLLCTWHRDRLESWPGEKLFRHPLCGDTPNTVYLGSEHI